MRKSIFAIAAMAASITAAGVPLTTHAAQIAPIASGSNYVVYAGQGMDSLCQTLEQVWAELENNGFNCPGQAGEQKPGTEAPDTPETELPGTGTPDVPDTEIPGTGMPDTPDTELPGTDTPDTGATEQPGTQNPDTGTPDEETVHPYVTQIVKLVNEERAKAGLPELTLDMGITAAANVRAVEIKQSFSHTRPDGSSFSTALKEQGVSYRGSGENIAWGQKSPEEVMNGWMNSAGHRANILNANFKNIGIGYYQDQNGVNYWVQLFTY